LVAGTLTRTDANDNALATLAVATVGREDRRAELDTPEPPPQPATARASEPRAQTSTLRITITMLP
jgi:hypothetical protein